MINFLLKIFNLKLDENSANIPAISVKYPNANLGVGADTSHKSSPINI